MKAWNILWFKKMIIYVHDDNDDGDYIGAVALEDSFISI
jgi:hypothetical protein